MPWIVNHTGDPIYKASIYAKEELPTWYEIYEKFWKQAIFNYSVEDDTELDPYWKMSTDKVILLTVCNQFNKMLFEDGMESEIIQKMNEHPSFSGFCLEDLRFTCEPFPQEDLESFMNRLHVGLHTAPPIYRMPLPTKLENPFESSYDHMDGPTGDFYLYAILNGTVEGRPVVYNLKEDAGELSDIIEMMMQKVRAYFENGIGWKDENGNLISDRTSGTKCPAGYDPAL